MAKTKYDFIKELLEDKKISQNQRERILELASREISLEGTLEERIQKIEDIIFNENPPANTITHVNTPEPQNLPKYIDPINLYNALLAYNQNPILKTTCHPISSANIEIIVLQSGSSIYDYKKHLELMKAFFRKNIGLSLSVCIFFYIFQG